MKNIENELHKFWKKSQDFYNSYAMRMADDKGIPLLYYVFQTDKYHYNPDLLIVGINPGGNYYGEPQLAQKDNYYLNGSDAWATCLQSVFGYKSDEYYNDFLSNIYENCVGTNRVFINTRREHDIDKKILPKAQELLEELIQIIQPKHIIVLGKKPFDALRGKSKVELKVEPNFKFSYHKGIPLAYIPNPSPMCRRYYTGDKIRLWQNILVKFLGDELQK